jgi:cellulose 1,4-beta-cellobiosidase
MARKFFLVLQFLYVVTFAQQPGTKTPEVHPTLTSERCTISGGCVTVNTSIVLEASFRDNHEVNGTANCYDSGFNSSICTDVSTCGKNCAYEGADYSSYGVKAEGDTLTLNLFTQRDNITREVAPRVYLLANDTTYDMLMLLNRELTFDVEMVDVPCGTNSALYLSEMEATGASSELNRAGAAYGTGYCDAQCPKQAFVNGEVRTFAQIIRKNGY